ncbi:MAG: hypothetical protein ACR2HR_02685 [Euzebya sp.]
MKAPETFAHNLDDSLGVQIHNPAQHTTAAAMDPAPEVDMVVGDYSGTLPVTAALVAAMTKVFGASARLAARRLQPSAAACSTPPALLAPQRSSRAAPSAVAIA